MELFSNKAIRRHSMTPEAKQVSKKERVMNRAFALLFIFLVTLVPHVVFAVVGNSTREVKFKDYPFEIARGERIVFQGVRGTVRMIASATGKSPVVRAKKILSDASKPPALEHFDKLSFTVRREPGLIIVEPKGPSSRQEWTEWSKPGQPELVVEIEAPSSPAEIHMHSGQVFSNSWKEQLAISLQDGRIIASDGEGALRATILRGEVKIDKQKGRVEIESHAAKVSITNGDGDVQVHNFAGETVVSGLRGDVSLRSKAGSASVSKIEGLDFDNGRGRLEATAVTGVVRGANDDGTVSIQLTGEADVSIETQDGPVSVKPPSGTGALLKLSSEEGTIVPPDSVHAAKNSGAKSIVARMDGAAKGVIIVRSKRGTIRVR